MSSSQHRPTSLPRYAPLQLDARGTSHLLIAQPDGLDAHMAFVEQLARLERLKSDSGATVIVLGQFVRPTGLVMQMQGCPDEAALERAVRQQFAKAEVGLRVYLCGDESFVWRMRLIATGAGLRDEELRMVASGTRRAVYCVHCGLVHDYALEDEVTCAGCGLRLAVRQHFSAMLGAYFGGCANPDFPYTENRT
jgi:dimethylamine monooxygenase subunit C